MNSIGPSSQFSHAISNIIKNKTFEVFFKNVEIYIGILYFQPTALKTDNSSWLYLMVKWSSEVGPLNSNPINWLNTLEQFVGSHQQLARMCLTILWG